MPRRHTHISDLLRQLVSYALFGCVCTAADVLVYWLLTACLGLHPLGSNVVSASVGITLSFVLNRSFTFGVKDNARRRYLRFLLVGILGISLQELVIWVLFSQMAMGSLVAKLVAVLAAGLVQFTLNRAFSFREMGGG